MEIPDIEDRMKAAIAEAHAMTPGQLAIEYALLKVQEDSWKSLITIYEEMVDQSWRIMDDTVQSSQSIPVDTKELVKTINDLVSDIEGVSQAGFKLAALEASNRGRKIVQAKHAKYEVLKQKIREEYATGKYESKDQCAENNYIQMRMKYSFARKALNNEPDPRDQASTK